MAIQNYAFKTMGSFLQDNTYYIPDYQREYSWEESQVEDFWMDLDNLREAGEDEHFFGQIVVQNEREAHSEEHKYIIDGQQRTTTSIIFLSAVSTICKRLMENNCIEAQEVTEDIQIKYIGRWSNANDRLQLRLSNNDSEFFKYFIQARNLTDIEVEPKTKAQRRIKNAYEYLLGKLTSEIEGLPNEEQYPVINEYFRSFISGFKVMYVETTSLEEAFIIFESLNARGKGLETADLLKNHIFKTSKGQIEAVKKKWEEMLNNLEGGDATKFIRYYWNSKEDFVRTQSLYKKMKQGINTEGKCLQVANELEKLSTVYTAISQKDSANLFSNSKINESLKNLKIFGASSFYPVVLAMFNKQWKEADILSVISEIERLIFRNIIIANNVANKYEIFFANLAIGISGKTVGKDEICKRIAEMKISDADFAGYFDRLFITKKPIIRYIFKKINDLYASKETTISDSSNVHIEHIMPTALGKWEIGKEDHNENLWKLGNLTLLGEEYNKKISNKAFSEKKKMYKESEIHITKQLVNYPTWNIETIKQRQDELTTDALKVW